MNYLCQLIYAYICVLLLYNFIHNQYLPLMKVHRVYLALYFCYLCIALLASLATFRSFRVLHWSHSRNTLCKCQPEHPYCQMNPKYQFTKFVWFITDGFPEYFAGPTFDLFKESNMKYTVWVPGYKWSHAIYTSWLTGMPATNYFGESVKGDHIIDSIARTNGHVVRGLGSPSCEVETANNGSISLHYYGPAWAWCVLTGGWMKGDRRYYEDVSLADESGFKRSATIYPTLYEEGKLEKELELIVRKGQSVIAHSGIFDKKNHFVKHELAEEADRVNKLHVRLKKFADEHPDYLLIVSSDHGTDTPGGELHGDGLNGNIGFFIFYNHVFGSHNGMKQIDVVDVAATVTKYWKGVDLPSGSTGVPRNYYGDDQLTYRNALRQSVVQLQEYAKTRGFSVDSSLYSKVLKDNAPLDDLESFANSLKFLMYTPRRMVPLFSIISSAAVSVIVLLFLSLSSRPKSYDELLFSISLYLPSFLLMLFTWAYYSKYFHDGGVIYMIWLAFVLLIFLIRFVWKYRLSLENAKSSDTLWFLVFFGIVIVAVLCLNQIPKWKDLHPKGIIDLIGLGCCLFVILRYMCVTDAEKHLSIIAVVLMYLSLNIKVNIAFLFDFHILGLGVLGICGVLFFRGIFHSIIDESALGASLFLAYIKRGDPQFALFLLLFVHPRGIRRFAPSNSLNAEQEKTRNVFYSGLVSLKDFSTHVVCVLYILAAIVTFHASGRNLDLDFVVDAGAVSVKTWNSYPSYSGFLMFLEKYGAFYLTSFIMSSLFSMGQKTPQIAISAALFLLGSISVLAFNTTVASFSIIHSLDECLITAGVFAIWGLVFTGIAFVGNDEKRRLTQGYLDKIFMKSRRVMRLPV